MLLSVAFQVGCWNTAITSHSPDHRHTIRIKELPLPPDGAIKVEYSSGFHRVSILMRGDAVLGFAHIAWAADSSKVGVLVTNRLGRTHPLITGFDTASGMPIPAEMVRDMLARGIQRRYGPTAAELMAYRGDALVWATQSAIAGQRSRFARR